MKSRPAVLTLLFGVILASTAVTAVAVRGQPASSILGRQQQETSGGISGENSSNQAATLDEELLLQPAPEAQKLKPCTRSIAGDDEICDEGEICAPHTLPGSANGVCASVPVGGVAFPTVSSDFPLPIGYFPLSGGSASSWPQNHYSGAQENIEWRKDPQFGNVAHCSQDNGSRMVLPSVPFGHSGAFAINFWMKKDTGTSLSGNHFQYVFSVTSWANSRFPISNWEMANQIHIYIPEDIHKAAGLVRVIIQDSDDGGSRFFMDSDGAILAGNGPAIPEHADLDDGKWHMITVTTNPDGREKGFEIYVDADLTAMTPMSPDVHGGHPIFADGNIILCGRTDLDSDRHFDGSLTQLSIYDESLTAIQIIELYDMVVSDGDLEIEGLQYSRDKKQENTEISIEAIEAGLPVDAIDIENEFKIQDFVRLSKFCGGPSDCEEDEVCAALQPNQKDALAQGAAGDVGPGLCAKVPSGGLPSADSLAGTPLPYAFYPLTGGDSRSWPIPKYSGTALHVDIQEDDVFGSVYHCSQKKLSVISIERPSYGTSGAFALNIWFRSTNLAGSIFQYLLSEDADQGSRATVWGEQLNVYLGELGHPTFGLVRTVYKDEDDSHNEIYVDSDGEIAVTEFAERTPQVVIHDGNWHMYTFTTKQQGEEGYLTFLDGQLVGKVDAKAFADAGIESEVPGGGPFSPSDSMFLCGRQDFSSERHFEGEIAHLSLFDQPLTDEAIQGLYNSISPEKLEMSRQNNVPPPYPSINRGPPTFIFVPGNDTSPPIVIPIPANVAQPAAEPETPGPPLLVRPEPAAPAGNEGIVGEPTVPPAGFQASQTSTSGGSTQQTEPSNRTPGSTPTVPFGITTPQPAQATPDPPSQIPSGGTEPAPPVVYVEDLD